MAEVVVVGYGVNLTASALNAILSFSLGKITRAVLCVLRRRQVIHNPL